MGRNELVAQLWDVLLRQSLVLTAERRMGKTSVVLKMRAEATADKLAIYRDLERVHTPLEFTQLVFDDVSSYLSRYNRTSIRAHQLLTHLSGTEVKGWIKLPDVAAPHWKTLLSRTIEDLVENQDRTIIMLWDELPLMLYNIKRRAGEDTAMEILDTLRALRQSHERLRMVFTGSVGLHNVISSLRASGYANDPTNDMYTVDVPPLSELYAVDLATRLLKGEGVRTDDLELCAHRISTSVDRIPYFIHHVVDQLKVGGGLCTISKIDEVVSNSISDPHDRWHLRYFSDRINIYYLDPERPMALTILDILATVEKPVRFNSLFDQVKAQMVTDDRDAALKVLSLLQKDHYVSTATGGELSFRFSLIQRAWRIHRGL